MQAIDVNANKTFINQSFLSCFLDETIGNNILLRLFYDKLSESFSFSFKCPFKTVIMVIDIYWEYKEEF